MPNPLNARIGRTRPSPAFTCPSEDSHTQEEQATVRRRPAGRESVSAVRSLWNAVRQRIERLVGMVVVSNPRVAQPLRDRPLTQQSADSAQLIRIVIVCCAALFSLAVPATALADYPRQTVSYVCDAKSDQLLIKYSTDYESGTNHDPKAGLFDPEHLIARREDSNGVVRYSPKPVRRTCALGTKPFDVVFEGDFWANPMGQCGAVPYPAVTVRRGSRIVVPRIPLDQCFERTVVLSITVHGRTEQVTIQQVNANEFSTAQPLRCQVFPRSPPNTALDC